MRYFQESLRVYVHQDMDDYLKQVKLYKITLIRVLIALGLIASKTTFNRFMALQCLIMVAVTEKFIISKASKNTEELNC